MTAYQFIESHSNKDTLYEVHRNVSFTVLLPVGQRSLRQMSNDRETALWNICIFISDVDFYFFCDLAAITDHSLGSVYEKVKDLWVPHFNT